MIKTLKSICRAWNEYRAYRKAKRFLLSSPEDAWTNVKFLTENSEFFYHGAIGASGIYTYQAKLLHLIADLPDLYEDILCRECDSVNANTALFCLYGIGYMQSGRLADVASRLANRKDEAVIRQACFYLRATVGEEAQSFLDGLASLDT